jgi:hypothetical protein
MYTFVTTLLALLFLALLWWIDRRLDNDAASIVFLWMLGLAFGLGVAIGALVAGLE